MAVSDRVARSWPDFEKQARGGARESEWADASVWFRTDIGAAGTFSLEPQTPAALTEDGAPTNPHLGVMISISTDPGQIVKEVSAEHGPDPELTDAQVRDLVRDMKEDRPDLDWDNLLMGRLAGPATPDRPNVPVWDYLDHSRRHPEVSFGTLTAARFPIRHFDGPWNVTSVDEELKPFPASYRGPRPEPRFVVDAEAIVRRYAAFREAGIIEWAPTERGLLYVRPLSAHRAVIHTWMQTLRPVQNPPGDPSG